MNANTHWTSGNQVSHLLTLNAGPNVESVNQLLQDGGEWSHTDATTHQYGNFKAIPVLVTLTVRPIQEQLGEWLSTQFIRIVIFSEVVGPGSNSSDVKAEVFLMWSRAEREGMELSWILSCTGNAHPLASLVVKVAWPLEVDTDHQRWKNVRAYNTDLLLTATHADELIEGKDDAWPNKEPAKEWILHEAARTMQEHQNVEDNIEVMGDPESTVGVSSSVLDSKHIHHYGYQGQYKC